MESRAACRMMLPALAFLVALACGAETPIPSPPTRWVTDNADFLSDATRLALDRRLEQYEDANKCQVVVWIGTTTGGVPVDDWAVRAFKKWGIGRAGKDDGLALFIFANDRKLRVEVGYGFEGTLPDAFCGRVINKEMVPRIRAGDRDGAVIAGIDALLGRLGGSDPGRSAMQATPLRTPHDATENPLGVLMAVPLGLFLILVMLFGRQRGGTTFTSNRYSDWSSGGGGSFGGGGGGGFSGGGGRSGGGGASGSW